MAEKEILRENLRLESIEKEGGAHTIPAKR